MNRFSILTMASVAVLTLAACGSVETEAKYPTGLDRGLTGNDNIYEKPESIFGEGGILFGRVGDDENGGGNGLAINEYLWRASLDTISFMPLASADPFGGVILTDWYSAPDKDKERFKVNVFIKGKTLRSDGVEVKVFNEVLKGGRWVSSDVSSDTARKLEDTILMRARQLRVADAD